MRLPFLLLLLGWLALSGAARAQLSVVTTFGGTSNQTTASFQVQDKWELQWNCPDSITVTVLGPDGTAAAGVSAKGTGTIFVGKGGKYSLQVTMAAGSTEQWDITISQVGSATKTDFALTPPSAPPSAPAGVAATGTATPAPAPAPTPAPPALPSIGSTSATPPNTGNLTEQQEHAVVVIKGDVAEGTGFLVHGPDGPAVVTNLHVLAANPNVKIFTTTGQQITTTGLKGASDRDLAMISIQDNHYSYLDLATDIPGTVQNGDEVITPGNSEGGEVVLDTKGSVLGVGPDRVEFSNPIYHGNSGGPVFHTKSGKVIAVVTQAFKVRTDDAIDKASFENKNSAITGEMRYFGLRIDTVPKWETYDWAQFLNQTTFLSKFHDLSRCLDSFMNGARYEHMHVATADDTGPPNALYYVKNQKLVDARDNFHRMSTDADASQRLDAGREMIMDLEGLAAADMDPIQNPGNFYAFEEIRAQQEIKLRQALAKEIENAGDRMSDMGH
jgi:S1-C subfamily serine protease